ncbi:MAG TPA: universal stress protein [Acidobacteriaceae bacterium]|nr:universal stress protein [Acidobacteriaceae bacterium]
MKPADANMPRPILVVSNLEQNDMLVYHAAAQARRTESKVILVHVIPPDPAEKKTPPGIVRIADPAVCRAVLDKLEFAALQLLWQGIICFPVVLSGDPAEQIVALARLRGVDRVLVAACSVQDRPASRESSIAERLLGELDIPLFVLGPKLSSVAETDLSDGRILLPLSLRHDRSEFVRFGSSLARETCSRLALLHVLTASDMTEQQRQQAQIKARTQLAAFAASAPNPLFPIEILVREGDVVQSIVDETMCPHRDLIVLGTGPVHHRAASRNNRVIRQVIAKAHCPVVALNSQRSSEPDINPLPKDLGIAAD